MWSRPLGELPEPAWFQRVLEFRESRRLFLDVMALRFRPHRAGTRVLVVAGSEDYTISLDSQRELAAFHDARLETVDGAPHDVMLTHPGELAAILDEFAGVRMSSILDGTSVTAPR